MSTSPYLRFLLGALCLVALPSPAGASPTLAASPIRLFDLPAGGPTGPVGIGGTTLAVAGTNGNSPVVYVYQQIDNVWVEAARLTTTDAEVSGVNASYHFATGVAVSPDGTTVFVGDSAAACAGNASLACGAVDIYRMPGAGWSDMTSPSAHLRPSVSTGEELGARLAITSDGATLAVIAGGHACVPSGSGCEAIYVFSEPVSGWADGSETAVLTSTSLASATEFPAIAADTGVIAANGSNKDVLVFVEPAGGWQPMTTETASLTSSAGGFDDVSDDFGSTLAVSGGTIVAGAPNIDTAVVFSKPTGGWVTTSTESAVLNSPGPTVVFGDTVAITGTTAVVLGQIFSTGSATLYLYDMPGGGWAGSESFTAELLLGTSGNSVFGPRPSVTSGSETFIGDGAGCSVDGGAACAGYVLASTAASGGSGLVIDGLTVDDLTGSGVRVSQAAAGSALHLNYDVSAIGSGGSTTFTVTPNATVTAATFSPDAPASGAARSCSIQGGTVSCDLTVPSDGGYTVQVSVQTDSCATAVTGTASLSKVTPASWDAVNGTFATPFPLFFAPLAPTGTQIFQAAPGAVITGTLPVHYCGPGPLTFTVQNGPPGTFDLNAATGAFTWTPPKGFDSSFEFSYFVSDGTHPSAGPVDTVFDEQPPAPPPEPAVGKGGGGLDLISLMLLAMLAVLRFGAYGAGTRQRPVRVR